MKPHIVSLSWKLDISTVKCEKSIKMLQLVMNADLERAVALVAVALVIRVLLRKYWTSIRDVPGPFVASFSSLWRVYHLCKGHIEEEIFDLHRRYGMIDIRQDKMRLNSRQETRSFRSHCGQRSERVSPRCSQTASPSQYPKGIRASLMTKER